MKHGWTWALTRPPLPTLNKARVRAKGPLLARNPLKKPEGEGKPLKLLSIAVPSYNSQDYLRRCIDTLLPGGERVEILIVNDGSKDDTAAIANEYQLRYPGIVKAIHQENGGHGAAVMTGLQNAQGAYFKVVDSDDRVDEAAYSKLLDTLETIQVDMVISNFVYDKVGVKNKKVMQYRKALEADTPLSWDDCGRLRKGHYILMHSVIYRTDMLKSCGLHLPRHTFYVDNLYVYIPMRQVKTLYYLDVDFYYYFIGREDQSVNEQVMIKRIDQQLKVNRMMVEQSRLSEIENKRQRQFLFNYLEIITVVSTVLLLRGGTKECLEKKAALWRDIRAYDEALYKRLRYGIMGIFINFPGPAGRRVALMAYWIAQKCFGFN